MPTNRKICSDIVEYLKANNIDDRISYRFVLSELRSAAQNFIKQDADSRRIFKQSSLWKPLPCAVELEEVPLVSCSFDISGCKTIMKSKQKIPKVFVTGYGDLIRITNIDGSGNFNQTSSETYESQVNRRYSNAKNKYFWILDDYLYIPDAYIEAVRVVGFFRDEAYLSFCECSTTCFKPLDMEFNCPDYLIDIVKQSVKKQLLDRYNIKQDDNPNLNNSEK